MSSEVDYKVQNALNFLGEQRAKDVSCWGYATDQESLLHAIETTTRGEGKREFRWMVWGITADTGAKRG